MAEANSPSVPPPHYAAATSSSSSTTLLQTGLDTFFDVVPQTDQTSFQVGYLGLKGFRAWVKGDVLIKLDEVEGASVSDGFCQCQIALYGIESDQDQSITIFSESQTLWKARDKAEQEAGSSDLRTERIPNTLPFSFPLTSDLPHCIHLSNSSLTFRLEATLVSRDPSVLPNAVRTTSVHLTRYSHPGSLRDEDGTGSLAPQTWEIDSPLSMSVQLQRKLFRRAEPICVFVRIPPPPRKLLSLKLRSVEANLLRIITGKRTNAKHELLLAHSGKLCRLHSTRSVVLRLRLHPPFNSSNMPYPHPDHDAAQGGPIYGRGGGGGCESITQETLLHDVKFLVRIHIGVRTEDGERKDVTLEQTIDILPGAAGNEDIDDGEDGRRRVEKDKKTQKGQPYASSGGGDAHASTSATRCAAHSPALIVDEDEEEYDGYEDVGRSLTDEDDIEGARRRGRSFDADGPPPTLLESQHDLQVEVDVEGVGAGVLREIEEHNRALPEPLSTLSPPPSIPEDYTWQPEQLHSAFLLGGEDDLPPPPPTPPPLLDNGALEGSHDTIRNREDGSDLTPPAQQQRPPPYMPFTARTSESRSNAQARPRHARSSNESDALQTRPLPPPAQEQVTETVVSPRTQSQQHANLTDESFPPAYTHPPPSPFTVSQHPPSYEA